MTVPRINAAIQHLDWDEVKNSLQPSEGGEGAPFELCEATVDDWRRYVESEFSALSASMRMWSRGRIIIVEVQSHLHEAVVDGIRCRIDDATGTRSNDLWYWGGCQIEHTEALNAEYLGGVKPDASVGPGYHLIEAIKPREFDLDEFHSLKVEVGISKPGAK
ncbi:hypothetical protein JG688_00018371 [Phytophthora aleatoria]|uniref:Uncharacterized protein n=1 Tax=Phytophthora aleatoria TaxID=2496075 RepID=A0A8J5IC56_9STRA|nr:hypothetical protein JG688_00018371 [Phytophthora aleatoria]